MKHSRKMFLIPEEMMRLIQDKTMIQTSPLIKSMSSLNQQMNNILDDASMPAEMKIKNHDQMFQRYLNYQKQQENHIPTVKIHSSVESKPQEPQLQKPQDGPSENKPISDTEILDTVPKRFRPQAEGLLRWMKKSPEAVQWDDKGEVILDGKSIRGSSISDLINDSLRTRKGFNPTGRDDFTQVLAKLNTPEDFVRNDDRRKLMSLMKAGEMLPPITPSVAAASTLSTPPTTPKKVPYLKRRAKAPMRGKKTLDWINY